MIAAPLYRPSWRAAAFALVLVAVGGASAPAQTEAAHSESRHPLEIVPPRSQATAREVGGLVALRSVIGGEPEGGEIMTLEFAASGEAIPLANTGGGLFSRWLEATGYWLSSTYNSITDGLTPPTPETFTKGFKSKNPDDFWQLVGDAGYKLKEISTDVGVVPDVGFKFRYVRE